MVRRKPHYKETPGWLPKPPLMTRSYKYTYIVIDHPDGDWTVATPEEIDALLHKDSFLGEILHGHAAQLALPDLSNN
jgi:hypothetical protein